MRIRWLFLALSMCIAGPGCSLFVTATRDLTYEAKLAMQDCLEATRDHRLAEQAWQGWSGARRDKAHSPDFARGFKTAFADYLRNGGTGHPPPLPPRHYWGLKYQNPAGHQAIEQWFAGFRTGAAAAHASGWRDLVVVPTKSALVPPQPPPLASPPLTPGSPVVGPGPIQELSTPKMLPVTPPTGPDPAATAPSEPTLPPIPGSGLKPLPAPPADEAAMLGTETPSDALQVLTIPTSGVAPRAPLPATASATLPPSVPEVEPGPMQTLPAAKTVPVTPPAGPAPPAALPSEPALPTIPGGVLKPLPTPPAEEAALPGTETPQETVQISTVAAAPPPSAVAPAATSSVTVTATVPTVAPVATTPCQGSEKEAPPPYLPAMAPAVTPAAAVPAAVPPPPTPEWLPARPE
jgi:hypothetical protein